MLDERCEECEYLRTYKESRGEYWGSPCYENVCDCKWDLEPDECPHSEKTEEAEEIDCSDYKDCEGCPKKEKCEAEVEDGIVRCECCDKNDNCTGFHDCPYLKE